jgi:hypothetical protein
MGKKQGLNCGGSKLTLGAFLRLDLPIPASALAPPSVALPAAQIKRDRSIDPVFTDAD